MKYLLAIILSSCMIVSSMAQSESKKQRKLSKAQEKELAQVLKDVEEEFKRLQFDFSDDEKARLEEEISNAFAHGSEMWADANDEMVNFFEGYDFSEWEEQIEASQESIESYFGQMHDQFNSYGLNEFYFDRESGFMGGFGKEILVRKEVDGEVYYEKSVNGKVSNISKSEIDELEAINKNNGNATGDEEGEIIKVESSKNSTKTNGEKSSSYIITVVKKLNGCKQ